MRIRRLLVACSVAAGLLWPGTASAVDPGGAPPEVQSLAFTTASAFNWAVTPDADTYNVYRSTIASANFNCLASGLLATNSSDAATPASKGVFFYLVTASRVTTEGTMGNRSNGTPRPNAFPCVPMPPALAGALGSNGAQADGVLQGVEAARNPGVANDLNGLAGGAVHLHTLEYFAQVVDREIPGRGMNWRLVRTYRSQISHDGQLGRNWIHNYDRRLTLSGPDLIHFDGEGHEDRYTGGPPLWQPVNPGLYTKIRRNLDGSYTLRERDGTRYRHFAITGTATDGRLESITDRMGSVIRFIYHPNGLLCSVVDTLGRNYNYYYDALGRLAEVEDFEGHTVAYSYDALGRLVSATRPAVLGTSIGNDFPGGVTTAYTYSSGFVDPRLNHNLLTVTAPGDAVPVIQNSYNAADELQTQFHGGTNSSGVPAGGIYQYAVVPLGGGNRRTTVVDRVGITRVFDSDPAGHLTREETFTIGLRPGDPPSYVTLHVNNSTGERVATTLPLGNQVRFTYDEFNPDRFQRGNLIEIRRVSDLVRKDVFGATVVDITATYQYEPLYTQQRTITNPVGRVSTYTYDAQEGDPSTNGVNAMAAEWAINLGAVPLLLGDVNGDGSTAAIAGNPVRLQMPTVTTFVGGRQIAINGPTQVSETLWRYNPLGQLAVEIDAEKNVKLFGYYAETDPDGDGAATPPPPDLRVLDPGTGGYLSTTTVDADPSPHMSGLDVLSRDNGLNPTPAEIGNTFDYDPLGNLIRSTDGNGVATEYEVNALGQVVLVRRDAGGLGPVSQQFHNARGEIVQRRVQDAWAGDGFLDIEFTHDILGSVVRTTGEGVAVTTYEYDAQGNRTSITQPMGNQTTMQMDERRLLLRLVRGDNDGDASNGGPVGSSVVVYNYDFNGNPETFIDGRGTAWDFFYDGMDRRKQSQPQPGLVALSYVFNADETIRHRLLHDGFGTRHQTSFFYDAQGRVVDTNTLIRKYDGTILFEDADLDGFVEVDHEYDRNSRRSRTRADNGRIQDFNYDGAGRTIETIDAIGNSVTFAYDDNNNLLQTIETELVMLSLVSFNTQYQYDSLNRMIQTTDNVGNQRTFSYDARDQMVQATDALGNTITYEYDPMGRRTQIVRDLRTGGTGAGAVYDQIRYQYTFDMNGRAERMTDPEGRPTTYTYDALDRLVRTQAADLTDLQYQYDGNDNVVRVIDQDGTQIDITYDAQDRPTVRSSVPAPGVHPINQTYSYDVFNRLVQSTELDLNGVPTTVTFDYDSLNRTRRETSQHGGNPVRTFDYRYDADGNRTAADYPTDFSPNTITYSYDALDRLIQTQDSHVGFQTTYSYVGPERIAERRHGNGTRMSHLDPGATMDIGHDGIRRVQAVYHYDLGGFAQSAFAYTRDPEGNITSESRLHEGGTGDVWVYDSAYRTGHFKRDVPNPASEAAIPGTGGFIPRQRQHLLDRVGNIVQTTVQDFPAGIFGTFGNTPNVMNDYGEQPDDGTPDDFNDDLGTGFPDGTNLGHRRSGNLATEGNRTYEYDALNRLVRVRDFGVPLAEYSYDGLNRLVVSRTFPSGFGTGNRYAYDGRRIAAVWEIDAFGTEQFMKRRFFWGNENHPVAVHNGAGLYYLHEDARGSIVAATDAGGAVAERITYGEFGDPEFRDAFNNPTGATESVVGNLFLHLGRHHRPETGFYEQGGGMFSPRLGRYVQRFLPGQAVGPLGAALNPPLYFPNLSDFIGMNPFWWCKRWFWHPGAWGAGGAWTWNNCWWWGGPWGWWRWQPWMWVGMGQGWWWAGPWNFWWCHHFRWWGWQTWWSWPGWWGWWPWWGWGGWCGWQPFWGWIGWANWWPWWGFGGWSGFWPWFGWWGWCGWWPHWNIWNGWTPWWWWGWWTWTPFWGSGFWGWSGVTWWWNWWNWVAWWPWAWWNWVGWCGGWWGWWGWNPWWWFGWWQWSVFSWAWGMGWWWGPIGWFPWFAWGWVPWWWWGWWAWGGWWGWWIRPWWWFGIWWWWSSWSWWWGWWLWPAWGWWRWWGAWWPWWGWWC